MGQYFHVHACDRCSCRWNCEAKKCRDIKRGWCFWCLAAKAASEGKPQISHDHEWAGGKNCSICKAYEEVRQERAKALG